MRTRQWLVLTMLAVAGCSPGADPPSGPSEAGRPAPPTAGSPTSDPERGRHERLAERLAKALRDPDFRRSVLERLDASPEREHKVHLQGFLAADGGRERARLARLAGESAAPIADDLDRSGPLELYLPVPDHRRQWRGDHRLIVATAEGDHDAPVGFDLLGHRLRLDPLRPPETPVLMVAPAEQAFGAAATAPCVFNCGGSGTGGGQTVTTPGLYLTRTAFTETFESWFKGQPEFEVHMLGQDGTGKLMRSYQCAGEYGGGAYTFDQNDETWSGSVLLFTGAQFDQYNAAHPGQNLRVFVLEDDDTSCQIKVDSTRASRLFGQIKLAYGAYTGGRDSTASGGILRFFKKATVLIDLFKAAASFIKTDDDIVGNAVADSVAAAGFFPGANWVVRGEDGIVTGALRLEMR
jgi:hypothetical protein